MAAKNCLIHFGVYKEDGDGEIDEIVELSSDTEEKVEEEVKEEVKLPELESTTTSSYESVSESDEEKKEVVKPAVLSKELKCPDCKKEFKVTHTYLNHISKKVCQKKK